MSTRTAAHFLFRHWRKMAAVLTAALAAGGGWELAHPARWRAEASLEVAGSGPDAVAAVAALANSRDVQRDAVVRFGGRLLPGVPEADRPRAFGRLLAVTAADGVVRLRLDGPEPLAATQALSALLEGVRAAGQAAGPEAAPPVVEQAAAQARRRLAAYLRRLGVADPRAERNGLAARRVALEGARAVAEADAAALADKAALLAGQVARTPATIRLASDSGRPRVLDEARAKLFELRTKEQELLGKYLPSSPLVQAVDAERRQVERSVQAYRAPEQDRVESGPNPVRQALEQELGRAQAALAAARARVRVVARQQADLDRRAAALSGGEAEYESLDRAVRDAEARLAAARGRPPAVGPVAVLQQPQADARPVGPGPGAVFGLAGAAGVVLAVLVALLAQRFGTRFDTPAAVERRLGLPVLTSIPREG